jgi:hypothetical protein
VVTAALCCGDGGSSLRPFETLGDAFRRQRVEAHRGIADREPACAGRLVEPLRPCGANMQFIVLKVVGDARGSQSGFPQLFTPSVKSPRL